MPAYNAQQYLKLTVESLRAQTVTDWQLLIMNDGSTDRTGEIADSLAQLDDRIRVIHQTNQGASATRNNGLALLGSSDDPICFFDADDLAEPDLLASLLALTGKHPDAPAVFGWSFKIDADGHPLSTNEPVQTDVVEGLRTWQDFVARNWVQSSGCALVKADALRVVDGYDSQITIGEDWDLWYRLALLGPLGYTSKHIYRYRVHPTCMSLCVRGRDGWDDRRRRLAKWKKLTPKEWQDDLLDGLARYRRRAVVFALQQCGESLRRRQVKRFVRCAGRTMLHTATMFPPTRWLEERFPYAKAR